MSFSEKVSMSGTALSFLLYECANSMNGQEGLLLGDIESVVTNHISDLHNDLCRLDTDIAIKAILPFPVVAQFYSGTGKIDFEAIEAFIANTELRVVGWYKFRKASPLKHTLRDKILSKGLQKYFENRYERKTFVSCMITCKESGSTSTRAYIYKFYKINRYGTCESIPDFTGNLGEKVTGYKKTSHRSSHKLFDNIVQSAELGDFRSSDAIFKIQKCLDMQLLKEAGLAASNEKKIRQLETEIQQMTTLLAERHAAVTTERANRFLLEQVQKAEKQIIDVCTSALVETPTADLISFSDELIATQKVVNIPIVIVEENSCKKMDFASILKKNMANKGETIIKTVVEPRDNASPSILDCDMDDGKRLKTENAINKSNHSPSVSRSKPQPDYNIIESSQEY